MNLCLTLFVPCIYRNWVASCATTRVGVSRSAAAIMTTTVCAGAVYAASAK
jgi:hypothetical protein